MRRKQNSCKKTQKGGGGDVVSRQTLDKKKRPEVRALSVNRSKRLGLQVKIQVKFVRMRAQAK
jgi:hypothetical protein